MNRNILISLVALFIGVGFLGLAGCGGTEAAKTGFLKDYSKLKPHPDIDGRFVYVNPNMKAGDYSKFIVDRILVSSPSGSWGSCW